MAVAWLKVLKAVPWSDVIAAAPQVANGARKLWDTVGRKQGAPGAMGEEAIMPAQAMGDDGVALLAAHIEQQDVAIAQMHNQLREASKLITELADQNAQLIAKMEAARGRLQVVGVIAAAGLVVSFVSLVLVLART
ncbi:hypothetical protein [Massilia sp.]|uniref:hypothetical protein n=1 Tax=Massilia sp. TaxID=1882437 RepID=UPI0028AD21B8|nr:hypothetical protein [Massilia sp.]